MGDNLPAAVRVSLPLHAPPFAGYYTDLYSYSPSTGSWTALSAAVSGGPSRRYGHGLTMEGGMLFVQGGWDAENCKLLVGALPPVRFC